MQVGIPIIFSKEVFPANRITTLLQQGKEYLKDRQSSQAKACFQEALALAPDNDEAKIFCHGFRYFDAEDYMKRHPDMESFEMEYLQLNSDKASRQEYFLRFLEGSLYENKNGRDKLISRKECVVDKRRCNYCLSLKGGQPIVTIFDERLPGGLRSPEQVNYLFSKDTEQRYRAELYTTYHYEAKKRYCLVTFNTKFGPYTTKKHFNFKEMDVCPYDVIAGTYDLSTRAYVRLADETIPSTLLVDPNPEIAELILMYYPR